MARKDKRIAAIYNALLDRGVSNTHALGMIANIKHESSFNPSAIGDGGTSGGLFQHHNERFQALKDFAKQRGTNWNDWQAQIDYALSEPDTKKYLSTNFSNPKQASAWFTMNWERPTNAKAKALERAKFLDTLSLPGTGKAAKPALTGMSFLMNKYGPKQSTPSDPFAEVKQESPKELSGMDFLMSKYGKSGSANTILPETPTQSQPILPQSSPITQPDPTQLPNMGELGREVTSFLEGVTPTPRGALNILGLGENYDQIAGLGNQLSANADASALNALQLLGIEMGLTQPGDMPKAISPDQIMQDRVLRDQQIANAVEENPIANIAGSVAQAIPLMAATSGMSAGGTLSGFAKQGAVDAAISNVLNNPDATISNTVGSGVLGGAFGGAVGKTLDVLPKAAGAAVKFAKQGVFSEMIDSIPVVGKLSRKIGRSEYHKALDSFKVSEKVRKEVVDQANQTTMNAYKQITSDARNALKSLSSMDDKAAGELLKEGIDALDNGLTQRYKEIVDPFLKDNKSSPVVTNKLTNFIDSEIKNLTGIDTFNETDVLTKMEQLKMFGADERVQALKTLLGIREAIGGTTPGLAKNIKSFTFGDLELLREAVGEGAAFEKFVRSKSERVLGKVYGQIKETIFDNIESNLGKESANAFKEIRQEFSTRLGGIKTLKKLTRTDAEKVVNSSALNGTKIEQVLQTNPEIKPFMEKVVLQRFSKATSVKNIDNLIQQYNPEQLMDLLGPEKVKTILSLRDTLSKARPSKQKFVPGKAPEKPLGFIADLANKPATQRLLQLLEMTEKFGQKGRRVLETTFPGLVADEIVE